jgi:SAM-dependent methyltransferase
MALPGWMAIADPFFLSHRALRREIAALAQGLPGRTLDVGCGTQPYRSLFPGPDYVGIEVPTASTYGSAKLTDVYYDGRHLPFADASFDVVFSSQVLEHVFTPDAFLVEVGRVLRPGGHFLLTTPFVWDEHEQPYDFARYSSYGLIHLAGRNGFDIEQARKTLADASVLTQLALAYAYKVLRRLPAPLAKALGAAISVPANILGLIAGIVLPSNVDLYLDNVMLWRKQAEGTAWEPS